MESFERRDFGFWPEHVAEKLYDFSGEQHAQDSASDQLVCNWAGKPNCRLIFCMFPKSCTTFRKNNMLRILATINLSAIGRVSPIADKLVLRGRSDAVRAPLASHDAVQGAKEQARVIAEN
jgi:hypothetical protein